MSETVAAAPQQEGKNAPPIVRVLSGFLLPLFFLIGLPLTLVSAFHAPAPHDMPIKIVGPAQVVTKITDQLDSTKQFSATQTDATSEARSSVKDRSVSGSILITPKQTTSADGKTATAFTVTTYVASAGGRSASQAVQSVGTSIAGELGTTAKVVDAVPLSGKDTLGTTIFYLLAYSSLGSYLVIIVLTQVMPKARLSVKFGAVTAAAVVLPLLTFALASIWVGDYGQSFGAIAALLGVMSLSVLTVGSLAIVWQSLLGNAAIFGIMATVVFMNFPSSGGAVPASMLPPFWQGVHDIWFGAGAYESFRSIVYFDGAQLGRWLPQLLAWAIGLIVLAILINLAKTVLQQKARIAELTPEPQTYQHLQVTSSRQTEDGSSAPQQSLTTGTEAAR